MKSLLLCSCLSLLVFSASAFAAPVAFIDDEDAGFTHVGFSNPAYADGGSWNAANRWASAFGNSATWTFSGLAAGDYDVYVSWRNTFQDNATDDATYTVSDGGGVAVYDQSPGVESYIGAPGEVAGYLNDGIEDVAFVRVASAVSVADGTLDVVLTATTDYPLADAVALTNAGDPIPEPATLALLGIGGLVAFRRRRARKVNKFCY